MKKRWLGKVLRSVDGYSWQWVGHHSYLSISKYEGKWFAQASVGRTSFITRPGRATERAARQYIERKLDGLAFAIFEITADKHAILGRLLKNS
jgi:hypothetical protein